MPDLIINPVLTEYPPIVKIVGVGGCGGNIAKHVYESGVEGVSFAVCNTDRKALFNSPITRKVEMGVLGAGGDPEKGLESAQEAKDEIQSLFDDGTEMVFVTAGLGKGTGTGAAPFVAQVAKARGVLTVGFVCLPPDIEGEEKMALAKEGMERIKNNSDAIVVVDTQRIFDLYDDLPIEASFDKADDIMSDAAKAMADIVNKSGRINIDMADVRAVLKDSGDVVMAYGKALGDNRAKDALASALDSPLLLQSHLAGAKAMLLNIMTSSSKQLLTKELNEIEDCLRKQKGVDKSTKLVMGLMIDDSLGEALSVTIVATGLKPEFARRRVTLDSSEMESVEPSVAPSVEKKVPTTIPSITQTSPRVPVVPLDMDEDEDYRYPH